MKRLLITGTSLATPKLGEEELKRVLAELGAAAVFDDAAVHELYMKLAAVHGAWLAEQQAKQVSPVAGALRRAGTCLIEIAGLLSGHETGFQTHVTSRDHVPDGSDAGARTPPSDPLNGRMS